MIYKRKIESVWFRYDSETGQLWRWLTGTFYKKPRWQETGLSGSKGYLDIKINSKGYGVHKVAWYIVHKQLPKYVDHIDNNKRNNKLINLREVTQSQNMLNMNNKNSMNTSGFRGVYFNRKAKAWQVQIKVEGKVLTFGLHKCLGEALQVNKAVRKYYGD